VTQQQSQNPDPDRSGALTGPDDGRDADDPGFTEPDVADPPGPALPPGVCLPPRGLLAYERARDLAVDPDPSVRTALALREDVRPELLYYLADDDSAMVRQAVAANPTTPLQAAPRLARDRDMQVRRLLAGRLARALPHLTGPQQAALRDMAVHALELLAADQAVRVRSAVASAMRDVDCAPPQLVARLARDVAREVAGPLLRGCLALDEAELLALLAARPEPWVAEAIARRPAVSAPVCRAVVARGDRVATTSLIANPGAAIPEETLGALADAGGQVVIGGADRMPRPLLPPGLLSRLSGLIDQAMQGAIAGTGAFDRAAAAEIAAVARRRLDWARDYVAREQPALRAARLMEQGALDEPAVWDAISWGDRGFVRAALALRARIPPAVVQRILDSGGVRAVTALAWRAGLSMRCARLLAHRVAGIPPRKLLNARDGTHYPLTETEMRWHLELFGIQD